MHRGHAGVQTRSTASSWTQTEPREPITDLLHQNPDEPDPPGLLDFLRRTEDLVLRELLKTCRSHAFDGFQPAREEPGQRVRTTRTLDLDPAGPESDPLHVSTGVMSPSSAASRSSGGRPSCQQPVLDLHRFCPGLRLRPVRYQDLNGPQDFRSDKVDPEPD